MHWELIIAFLLFEALLITIIPYTVCTHLYTFVQSYASSEIEKYLPAHTVAKFSRLGTVKPVFYIAQPRLDFFVAGEG